MPVGYLASLAQDLLDAADAALVQATTGHPPPTFSYRSLGEPTYDRCCEGGQVTVHLESLWDEMTRREPNRCSIVPYARFVVTLLRCYPGLTQGGSLPSIDAMDEATEGLMIDLWALETEMYDRIAAKTLFDGASCATITVGDAEPIRDEGNCAGWKIPVTVELNDSGPTGS